MSQNLKYRFLGFSALLGLGFFVVLILGYCAVLWQGYSAGPAIGRRVELKSRFFPFEMPTVFGRPRNSRMSPSGMWREIMQQGQASGKDELLNAS